MARSTIGSLAALLAACGHGPATRDDAALPPTVRDAAPPPALPCNRADVPALDGASLAPGWTARGHVASLDATTTTIVIAADVDAPIAIARARATIVPPPTFAIVLGGVADDGPGLVAVATALAGTPPIPVVLVPGDREPVATVEEAVAALARAGVPAIDGRRATRLELGARGAIALVGGALASTRAPAGVRGCVASLEDRARAAGELAAIPRGVRVLASYEGIRDVLADDDPACAGARGDVPASAAAGADVVIVGGRACATPPTRGTRDGGAHVLAASARALGVLALAPVGDAAGWIWHAVALDEPSLVSDGGRGTLRGAP